MIRWLYQLLWYPLTPLLLLRLWWRGKHFPEERQRWRERLGWLPPQQPGLWLHAVSMGEVRAALPLIHALLERYPDEPLLITTVTATGSRQVRESLGGRVQHAYLPYDLYPAVALFLSRVRPRVGIIMETELWPTLYRACQGRGIPLLLANARLSERSFRGYQRAGGLIRDTLSAVHIAARGQDDAARFATLGATQLRVVGNLKFDLQLPADLANRGRALRQQLGTQRPVWIAGSTHEGEEQRLLAVHQQLRQRFTDLLLVLVPRHPERFTRTAALCQQQGLVTARRSVGERVEAHTAVYLGDTLGELLLLYATADVAFVGGSLVDGWGCHNLLEPAALAKPVIFGPVVYNFVEISAQLLVVNAACQVTTDAELVAVLSEWLRHPEQRVAMGERGRGVVLRNRGALEGVMAYLGALRAGID